MILLATQAMPQTRAHAHPNLGGLVTPRHYCSLAEHGADLCWAADNDCFQGLHERRFLAMLDALGRSPTAPRFVTVPDVVADAAAMRELWRTWAPRVRERELPAALVLQDGQARVPVPWGELAAYSWAALTTSSSAPTRPNSWPSPSGSGSGRIWGA
jgi:hypothetical protein